MRSLAQGHTTEKECLTQEFGWGAMDREWVLSEEAAVSV